MSEKEISKLTQQFRQLIETAKASWSSKVFVSPYTIFAKAVTNTYSKWASKIFDFVREQSKGSKRLNIDSLFDELRMKILSDMEEYALSTVKKEQEKKGEFFVEAGKKRSLPQMAIKELDAAWGNQFTHGRCRSLNKRHIVNSKMKRFFGFSRKNMIPKYRIDLPLPDTTERLKGCSHLDAGHAKNYAEQMKRKKIPLRNIRQCLYSNNFLQQSNPPEQRVCPIKRIPHVSIPHVSITLEGGPKQQEKSNRVKNTSAVGTNEGNRVPDDKKSCPFTQNIEEFSPEQEGYRYYQQSRVTFDGEKNKASAPRGFRRYKIRPFPRGAVPSEQFLCPSKTVDNGPQTMCIIRGLRNNQKWLYRYPKKEIQWTYPVSVASSLYKPKEAGFFPSQVSFRSNSN